MVDVDIALIATTRAGCADTHQVYADWLDERGQLTLASLVRAGIAHGPEAYDLLPRAVWSQIADHERFVSLGYWTWRDQSIGWRGPEGLSRLFELTQTCLRNLDRHDVTSADNELRAIIVPELWERLQPSTRTEMRRITTTIAEFAPIKATYDGVTWSATHGSLSDQLTRDAERMHLRINHVAKMPLLDLAMLTVETIAESNAHKHWPPETPVYECSFAYRLVPTLLHRVIAMHGN